MIRKFLQNIFSISNYGDTHYLVMAFGIKIKIPKKEYAEQRKNNIYNYYKNNRLDITSLPPAEGDARKLQLANLALLKELDYVCRQNELTYWIDFGTLLGAVRHKGFIPWDDDIDVGMLRKDYDKIIDAFNKSSRNPDIYATYWGSKKNSCQYYIRIEHKKLRDLYVDIFPYDFYGKTLTENEQLNKTKKKKKKKKNMQKKCDGKDTDKILKTVAEERTKLLYQTEGKSDLVWGLDFNHRWKNWFSSYDEIFPIKTINFEGINLSCINKPETYLKKVYGDYMAYPNKISVSHSLNKFSEEEIKIIEDLIK